MILILILIFILILILIRFLILILILMPDYPQDYLRYGLELVEYHILAGYDEFQEEADAKDRVFVDSVQVGHFESDARRASRTTLNSY